MTDLTNEELNEAVALALGWEHDPGGSDWWTSNSDGLPLWVELKRACWATSVDACLDDLLPVVRAKGLSCAFEECWAQPDEGTEAHWFWYVGAYRKNSQVCHADDPSLARAICKVFLEVMEND